MATSLPSTDLATQLLELEKEAMKKFKQVDKKYEMNGLQKVLKLTITVCDGHANCHDDKHLKPTLSRRKIKQRKRRDDFRRKKRSYAREKDSLKAINSSSSIKDQSSVFIVNPTGIIPKEVVAQDNYLYDFIVDMKERKRKRRLKTFQPRIIKNYPLVQSYKPRIKQECYCETCEKLGIFNRHSWLTNYRWYNKPHFHHQYLKNNSSSEDISFYYPDHEEVCRDCMIYLSKDLGGRLLFNGWNSISHFHHYRPPDDPPKDSNYYIYDEVTIDGDLYVLSDDQTNRHDEDPNTF